jgi:hypothetical protein
MDNSQGHVDHVVWSCEEEREVEGSEDGRNEAVLNDVASDSVEYVSRLGDHDAFLVSRKLECSNLVPESYKRAKKHSLRIPWRM